MPAKKRSKPVAATASTNIGEPMKVGDRVRIRDYGGQRGKIVEFRGLLGPGGAPIYRVLISRRPLRDYIELREDQLERIEPSADR